MPSVWEPHGFGSYNYGDDKSTHASEHGLYRRSFAAPRLWNAEQPNLYRLRVTLFRDDQAVHAVIERFGFRTVEVRPSKGVYVNGQRVLLKGVNRHSFRRAAGARALRFHVAETRVVQLATGALSRTGRQHPR